MKRTKIFIGILIALNVIMLGATAGMLASCYLSRSIAESQSVSTSLEEETAVGFQSHKDQQLPLSASVHEGEDAINLTHREDIYYVLDIWRKLIEKTSKGELDEKEAEKWIYTMASDAYKRNVPKSLMVYRLVSVKENRPYPLQEMKFSNIQYEGEDRAYVSVEEIYGKRHYSYKLKLVKEKNQWTFGAQVEM